jgi:hypothetical protein
MREFNKSAVRIVVLAGVVTWGLTDVQRRARVDPDRIEKHRTDFSVYTIAAKAFFEDGKPYEVTNPRGWHYIYPPLFAILVRPIADLRFEYQAFIWYLVSVLLVYGAWIELGRLLTILGVRRRTRPESAGSESAGISSAPLDDRRNTTMRNSEATARTWPGAERAIVVMAWIALTIPFLNCLQRGQVVVILVYPLLLGLRLLFEAKSPSRAVLAGIVLAFPAAIKVTPALPIVVLGSALVLVVVRRSLQKSATIEDGTARYPAVQQAIGGCAGMLLGLAIWFLAFPGAILGFERNRDYLLEWVKRVGAPEADVGSQNQFDAHSFRNQSLSNAAFLFSLPWDIKSEGRVEPDESAVRLAWPHSFTRRDTPAAFGMFVARGIIAMLLVLVTLRLGFGGTFLDLGALFGFAATATLLVSPISWVHHFPIGLSGLVLVPLWHERAGRSITARAFAIAPLMLIILHYALFRFTAAYGLLGLGTTLWWVAAAIGFFAPRPKS